MKMAAYQGVLLGDTRVKQRETTRAATAFGIGGARPFFWLERRNRTIWVYASRDIRSNNLPRQDCVKELDVSIDAGICTNCRMGTRFGRFGSGSDFWRFGASLYVSILYQVYAAESSKKPIAAVIACLCEGLTKALHMVCASWKIDEICWFCIRYGGTRSDWHGLAQDEMLLQAICQERKIGKAVYI